MASLIVDEEIVLKAIEEEDAEPLFLLIERNRAHLREWLPWVDANVTADDSRTFIASAQEQDDMNLGVQCGIWFEGCIAGMIGFHRIDWMNKSAEIGYWLGAEFQGKGIMTRACRAMIECAFYEYELRRVQIRCADGNRKSCAIMERLGFVKEGTARQAEFLYDRYVDLHVYSLLDDEWKTRTGIQEKVIRWKT